MFVKIKINGETISLNRNEVSVSKRMVSDFIDKTKKKCEEKNGLSFYITFLIVMQILSQELLSELKIKEFSTLLKKIDQNRVE